MGKHETPAFRGCDLFHDTVAESFDNLIYRDPVQPRHSVDIDLRFQQVTLWDLEVSRFKQIQAETEFPHVRTLSGIEGHTRLGDVDQKLEAHPSRDEVGDCSARDGRRTCS